MVVHRALALGQVRLSGIAGQWPARAHHLDDAFHTVIPELARTLSAAPLQPDMALQAVFLATENLAYALVNVAAFGLYTLAGLLLLPTAFATPRFPRWLVWLGVVEWDAAGVATLLLIAAPDLVAPPLAISFALFAPRAWGRAWWLMRHPASHASRPHADEEKTMPKVEVDHPAPNFTLTDYRGRLVRLSDFRGQRVLLVFNRGFM